MFRRVRSIAAALVAPLILLGCVITPGKFVSTLTINADRSFAFTYVGEVYAVDLGKEMSKGMSGGAKLDTDGGSDDDTEPQDAVLQQIASQKQSGKADKPAAKGDDFGTDADDKSEDTEKKNAAIAEALSKEAGYRRVQYLGKGKFQIDYAISGKLTYLFVFPFNSDAEVMFPFLSIELRGSDKVRVKAPAFAAQSSSAKGMGMGAPSGENYADKLDGVFTLTTDADIVSQNNENGATTTAGRKVISWKASPTTKDAPMAVLKVAPLN